MKRKHLLYLLLLSAFGIISNAIRSYPSGTPGDGRTGSPGDGNKTCKASGCHSSASLTDASGFISSNVPSAGYTAGSTYIITVTVDGSGYKGLCVSPQKTDGTLLGSLTAGAGNQLVSGKYITHTTPKTTAPAVWTFTWVAPAAGTGAVNFYGAFANNKTQVRKTIFTINENQSSGINENTQISDLDFYPNPATANQLNIAFGLNQSGNVKVSLFDLSGKEVAVLKDAWMSEGKFESALAIPQLHSGIYFVRIETKESSLTKKLLIQQD